MTPNAASLEGASHPGLLARDVWLRYGTKRPWALAGVDLAVPLGCLAAVVGTNGAGKTSLFRSWLGFERPERGRLEVLGFDPRTHRSDVLLRSAYVAQDPALFGGLTCRDHLRYAAMQRPGFELQEAEAALDAVAVPMASKAGQLSGGQRVQLSLAIARGCRAGALFLDEPLASLDPVARRAVVRSLADYAHDQDATILVSSHLVSDLEGAFDHLVAIGSGRVLISASIESIGERYIVRPVRLDAPTEPAEVGRFVGRDGSLIRVLERGDDESSDTQRASVEDVVMAVVTSSQPEPPVEARR